MLEINAWNGKWMPERVYYMKLIAVLGIVVILPGNLSDFWDCSSTTGPNQCKTINVNQYLLFPKFISSKIEFDVSQVSSLRADSNHWNRKANRKFIRTLQFFAIIWCMSFHLHGNFHYLRLPKPVPSSRIGEHQSYVCCNLTWQPSGSKVQLNGK